jgi:thiamine pyrophosphate-dependent acetolactate synthase large subunit-like protein
MPKPEEPSTKNPLLKRRDLLKAGGGAVSLALLAKEAAAAESAMPPPGTPASTKAAAGDHVLLQTPPPETEPPATTEFQPLERTNSDFMVDVLKTLGFEYMIANPADLLAALHESLTGPYGGNKSPEWITVTHEEIGVAMCHGYYKIEGKPAITSGHSTVGLMHASMAVYNAYADRVPVYMLFGDQQAPTDHSVLDASAPVRDFIRRYEKPESLEAFAEQAVRLYGFAMQPPMLPVLMSVDFELQERALKGPGPRIPKLTVAKLPEADSNGIEEAARLLAQAQNPLIIPERYAHTQHGIDMLVELAELLQAPVLDRGGRMNFPKRHPLNVAFTGDSTGFGGGPWAREADVILGLEGNMAGVANQTKGKTISIGAEDAFTHGNYQEIGHYGAVDLLMAGDAETSMPKLLEAVKRQINRNQRVAAQARGAKIADATRKAFEQDRVAASYGWDASPVSTARMCAEIWEAVKNEDWSYVSEGLHFANWPARLWPMEKKYHFNGGSGAGGIGYNLPAAIGAALANKKYGRFTVNIQCDGDLMYCPGALWTAAHHKIPILNVMHNNRAYHAEAMYLRRAANLHGHPLSEGGIGVRITDPNIDFAKIAQGMGVYAEGPIMDPKDLGPALKRAVAVVKQGQPALIDVVTQPR